MRRRKVPNIKSINLDLSGLTIANSLSPYFYEKEARTVLKKYNLNDKNFKYFFKEFIELTKNFVELETLRDTISKLQRLVCLKINKLEMEEGFRDFSDEFY